MIALRHRNFGGSPNCSMSIKIGRIGMASGSRLRLGLRLARPLFILRFMMQPSRRKWIELSAAAVSMAGFEVRAADAPAKRRTRFGVSTYSYWHFKGDKYPIERVIDDAGRMGFDGVEVLHRQMSGESVAYLNQLKRSAFRNGLDLIQLSIHQDFVSPDAQERRKHIDHTLHCIELAAQLGVPSIRLNSGRWKTIPSFDDLMKVKGDEPPLAGYTNQDALKWSTDSILECIPAAEKAGVILDLENHCGLTTKTESPDELLGAFRDLLFSWTGIRRHGRRHSPIRDDGSPRFFPIEHAHDIIGRCGLLQVPRILFRQFRGFPCVIKLLQV